MKGQLNLSKLMAGFKTSFGQKLIPIIFLVLFSIHNLRAQETLTLENAIKIALEKNNGIAVAQNNSAMAKNSAKPGNAGLFPRLDLQGGYNYSSNNTDLEFAGGIPPSSVRGAETTNLSGSVGASYLLFDGLGVIYTFQKLKEAGELGETQTRLQIESILLQTVNLYYNIARAQENINVAREAQKNSFERYQRAEARSEYGGLKINALNAKVDFNTDSSAVIIQKMNLANLKHALNVLLGRSADTEFSVSSDVKWNENLSMETMRQKARENNAAILVAAHNLYIAELDLKTARSTQYPRISASASYGYNRMESEAGIVLSNTQIGFSGGITLSYNLFDGRKKHIQIQNAKLAIENNKERQEEAALNVERDLFNAWEKFTQYRQLLKLQEENLETARLNFERTKELFNVGQLTGTQFREAQLNLLRVQNSINDTRFSAKLAEVEITALSGDLLKMN